eukprot:4230636-Pleurochrysis_carterae.AAC.2
MSACTPVRTRAPTHCYARERSTARGDAGADSQRLARGCAPSDRRRRAMLGRVARGGGGGHRHGLSIVGASGQAASQ